MITAYEIRNVLRVYGNQLKKRSVQLAQSEALPHAPIDLVDISIDARRRQMVSQMSNHLIAQIVPMNREKYHEGGEKGSDSKVGPANGGQKFTEDYEEML